MTVPQRGAAHRQLDVFTGTWRARGLSFGAEGQSADDPRASAVPWTSEETYEWLPGGFFMLHRWDAQVGTRAFKGTEIIGYDEAEGGFFTRMFDNAGNHPEYIASVAGNAWTFEEPSTRAAVTVSGDGNRMDWRWEWRKEGGDWLPLCDRTANRVRWGSDVGLDRAGGMGVAHRAVMRRIKMNQRAQSNEMQTEASVISEKDVHEPRFRVRTIPHPRV